MGISGISPWSLLLILIIIILLFGTKKIRSLGSDLGQMLGDFNRSMKSSQSDQSSNKTTPTHQEKPTESPNDDSQKTKPHQ